MDKTEKINLINLLTAEKLQKSIHDALKIRTSFRVMYITRAHAQEFLSRFFVDPFVFDSDQSS